MGVMKAVGQAVRQGQSFAWDNDRMAHVLRCIGIAPWGYVKKRRDLESTDENVSFCVCSFFFLCLKGTEKLSGKATDENVSLFSFFLAYLS